MALSVYIIDHAGDGAVRYSTGDVVDIFVPVGTPTLPLTGPFRIINVITTMTVEQAKAYLAPKTNAQGDVLKRREYYLDTAKMAPADLAYWNANRYISVPEATFVGWLSKK